MTGSLANHHHFCDTTRLIEDLDFYESLQRRENLLEEKKDLLQGINVPPKPFFAFFRPASDIYENKTYPTHVVERLRAIDRELNKLAGQHSRSLSR